jgi:hypothetical protein
MIVAVTGESEDDQVLAIGRLAGAKLDHDLGYNTCHVASTMAHSTAPSNLVERKQG